MMLEVLSKITYLKKEGIIRRDLIVNFDDIGLAFKLSQDKYLRDVRRFFKPIYNLSRLGELFELSNKKNNYISGVTLLDPVDAVCDLGEYTKISIKKNEIISCIKQHRLRLIYFNLTMNICSTLSHDLIEQKDKNQFVIDWLDNIIKQLENYENLGDFT